MKFRLTSIYDKNAWERNISENNEFESLRFGTPNEPNKVSEKELLEFGFVQDTPVDIMPQIESKSDDLIENVTFNDIAEDDEALEENEIKEALVFEAASEYVEDFEENKEVVEVIEEKDNFNNGTVIIKKVTKKVLNWSLTIIFAFTLAMLINIYVLRPSKVSGDSMVPTLVDNETVYISRLPYVFGDVKFGDIVVIDSNLEANRTFFTSVAETLKYNLLTKDLFEYEVDVFWIKRVIGVEGDVIEFKDDSIYRNGQKLQEEYIYTQDVFTYPNGVTITVEEGFIFVMGDNRNVSRDSRHEGQIPVSNVVGKLVFH